MATSSHPPNRMEQPAIWGALRDDPEFAEKLAHFRQMMPAGTASLVDVGCGDGALTNPLGETLDVTGVDLSRTALEHVTGTAVHASATDLPFPDGAFDVALSSQVLEHLSDGDYRRALSELRRVARRAVLISVPYREDLSLRTIRCPRCGDRHHVWGHVRRFTVDSLIADVGLPARDIRVFGALQDPPWPRGLLWLSHRVVRGHYTPEGQNPMCPACANTDYSGARGLPGPAFVAKRALDRVWRRPRLPFWLAVRFDV